MPARNIRRGATISGYANATNVPIYVDSDDNKLKMIPAGSGTTEVDIADVSSTQTFTNKTLTSPTITAPTITGAAIQTGPALIAAGGTLTLTAAAHGGKTIALDTAAGSVVTLPTSSGSGTTYKFLVTVTATSNSHVIKVGNATDEFRGFVIQDASEATAPNIFWAADNDDTITLNRTTTGLAAQGEYFEVVDAVSGEYYVRGYSQANGIEATPFSATV